MTLQEQYNSLTNKTVAFLTLITSIYAPQYIVKADDDVYLRVDRIPYAVKQWGTFQSGVTKIITHSIITILCVSRLEKVLTAAVCLKGWMLPNLHIKLYCPLFCLSLQARSKQQMFAQKVKLVLCLQITLVA